MCHKQPFTSIVLLVVRDRLGYQEVDRCCSKGVTCIPLPNVNKTAHSGFTTQRKHHQKSKQECQWPNKKDLCPPKFQKSMFGLASLSF